MRRTLLCAGLAALLAVSGCKSGSSSTTPGPTPATGGKALEVPADQTVALADTLNGTALAKSTSGPWQVRGGAGMAARDESMKAMEGAPGAKGGADGFGSGGLGGLGTAGGGGGPTGAAMKSKAMRAMPAAEPSMAAPPPPPSAPAPEKKAMAPREDEGFADKEMPARRDQPAASPLRAGSTDDNAEFGEFVKFLASWSDRSETAGKANLLDVRDRRFIRVVDDQGRPVPTAQVSVVDEAKDKVVWASTTYGDGAAPFYPRVAAGAGKYTVEAAFGGKRGRASWDGAGDLKVSVAVPKNITSPIQLDVLFAIDTTGSMQDEIDRIKTSLLAVTDRLKGLKQEFDLRYSAVLFRDLGDEFVTSTYPFTSDIAAFASALQQVNADGGGDMPESVNQALAEAVRAPWRPGAAKIVFLVGDAPPHMDYQGDVTYGQSIKAAVAKGVRIHSVAASGLDPLGTLVWRQVSQFTRGKFIFIEYGSAAAAADSHGVTGEFKSNNLDDIVFEQIRDELAYWGKEGPNPNVAAQ